MLFRKHATMVESENALAGRTDQSMPVPDAHHVNGHPLVGPWPDGYEVAVFGMGCFWGAERIFWQLPGVYSTFVGYAGGFTPNPTYDEVCSGMTGQTEVVGVVFDPEQVSYEQLIKAFWEGHDPTQGLRQGNDVGSQYRSAVYTTSPEHQAVAESTKALFEAELADASYGAVTTEIKSIDFANDFYYAEPYHQQYLSKNPNGYCGIGGTGVSCPIGIAN
ncbi:MAG: peptide-methionine (S)-S-oxide reductase MsrA [Actinomycetota bacterium]